MSHPRWQLEKKIWKKYMNSSKNIDCFFIECKYENFTITSDCFESYTPGIFQKTIQTLQNKHFNKYDFIIRSNLSSFFIFKHLHSFLSTLPLDIPLYTGFHFNWGIQGTSIFLNQKSRSILLQEGFKDIYYESILPDDRVIAKIFKKYKISYQDFGVSLYIWDYQKNNDDNLSLILKSRIPIIRLKNKNINQYEKIALFLLKYFYNK